MADTKLFSVDSELIVLSSILKNPSLIHSIDGLRSHMFSSTPHQILFEEFELLKENKLVPEPQVVIESLASKNSLDKIGGKHFIEVLLKREGNEDAFKKFVEILVKAFKARSYLSIIAGVKKDNLNADNVDEMISLTRKGLDDLVGTGGGGYTVHVSEVVKGVFDEIIARTEKPGIRGVSWGIPSIDRATGGKSKGDLIVIAARPGQGKTSAFCNSILADAEAGVPSLMISREMRIQELMERLVSIDTGIPNTNIRLGVLSQDQRNRILSSLEKLKKRPIYLDYNMRCSDPLYLESTITKFKNQHGIEIVYLDYIQIATERDEGQTQEIGRLTRLFKILSNDLGICSVLASQLNRRVEEREDKRPLLSDMKQSGAIEEDPDFVIGLYRDEYYNKDKNKNLMEYLILKHRNGPPGTVTVRFDGPTYRIGDV